MRGEAEAAGEGDKITTPNKKINKKAGSALPPAYFYAI